MSRRNFQKPLNNPELHLHNGLRDGECEVFFDPAYTLPDLDQILSFARKSSANSIAVERQGCVRVSTLSVLIFRVGDNPPSMAFPANKFRSLHKDNGEVMTLNAEGEPVITAPFAVSGTN